MNDVQPYLSMVDVHDIENLDKHKSGKRTRNKSRNLEPINHVSHHQPSISCEEQLETTSSHSQSIVDQDADPTLLPSFHSRSLHLHGENIEDTPLEVVRAIESSWLAAARTVFATQTQDVLPSDVSDDLNTNDEKFPFIVIPGVAFDNTLDSYDTIADPQTDPLAVTNSDEDEGKLRRKRSKFNKLKSERSSCSRKRKITKS